jgi:hypothetical protein
VNAYIPSPSFGGVPERSKGTDCKSVGEAFGGSNPPPSTLITDTPGSVFQPATPLLMCGPSAIELLFVVRFLLKPFLDEHMDIVSHGLWGVIALGRKRRSDLILACTFSLLPDVFGEGIMFLLVVLGLGNMPSLEHGHPNITDFPLYAQNFYNATHSLLVFAAVFAAIWIIRRKPFWLLLAWALHIIIDIPTHSFKLFPTPFLWPVSDFKVDGIPWDHSIILIPNIMLLVLFYSLWFFRGRGKDILRRGS